MPRRAPGPASQLSRMKGLFSCVPVRFRVYQYRERGSVGDAQLPVNMVEVDLHRTLGQP